MKTDLLKLPPKQFCAATGACPEGAKFALKHRTMKTVWEKCQRLDWLCWILEAIDAPYDEKTNRQFMVWCARNTPLLSGGTILSLITDERSLFAIYTAELFSLGYKTSEELSAAESAAESAAWSAARSAARSAAWSAARSAARSAAWSAARSVAESAAESAARSAAESVAWSAALSAARSAAESAQATEFKRIIKNPFA